MVSRVGTIPTAPNSDLIFDVVSREAEAEFEEEVERTLIAGELYTITKLASAGAGTQAAVNALGRTSANAEAQAVVDPIISVDQGRFDILYAPSVLSPLAARARMSQTFSRSISRSVSRRGPSRRRYPCRRMGVAGVSARVRRGGTRST